MARTISFYIDAALDAYNAGFTSKAAPTLPRTRK